MVVEEVKKLMEGVSEKIEAIQTKNNRHRKKVMMVYVMRKLKVSKKTY